MRLIDADALIDRLCCNCRGKTDKTGMCERCAARNTLGRIYASPTIDAVPVVRCKECKYWDQLEPGHPYGYCHAAKHGYSSPHWEICIYRKTIREFFCADGERREG